MKTRLLAVLVISVLCALWWVSNSHSENTGAEASRGKSPKQQEPPSSSAAQDENASKERAASAGFQGQNKLERLRGKAEFSNHQLDDGSYCAINPVYKYQGMEVGVPGEDIPCPLSSLKGGRGELVFNLWAGKPITARTVGELYLHEGRLHYHERLAISYRRGIQFAFVIDKKEETKIQTFGVALVGDPPGLEYSDASGNPLLKPRSTFECGIRLVQENKQIGALEFDSIKPVPFSENWIGFDVTGQEMDLTGKSSRVVWFKFDPTTNLLSQIE